MLDLLQKLSTLNGVSGAEDDVRAFILSEASKHARCHVDALGNIIAFKKGNKPAQKKLMLCAHMDEVGFIINAIDENGYLWFTNVGGIDPRVVLGRAVRVGSEGIHGVIGAKPIHLLDADERKQSPGFDKMYIDIGAENKEQAEQYVKLGDIACFDSAFVHFGDNLIKGKALDDRAGCAVLLKLLERETEFDTYFAFTVQEEVGTRGAATAAFSVAPDYAIVLEATTAADIPNVKKEQQVCRLGEGPAVSFMDGRTVYDRQLYKQAFEIAAAEGIPCQPKAGTSGGNDAGAIHLSREGVRTTAISVPCRYLHSASCVIHKDDLLNTLALTEALAAAISAN